MLESSLLAFKYVYIDDGVCWLSKKLNVANAGEGLD